MKCKILPSAQIKNFYYSLSCAQSHKRSVYCGQKWVTFGFSELYDLFYSPLFNYKINNKYLIY